MKSLYVVMAPVALAGALLIGARQAQADDCQKRTINADHKLHDAIKQHGPDSPDAQHWRQELAEARSYCWNHEHKWWDEDAHAWRDEHNWDDHDHEH